VADGILHHLSLVLCLSSGAKLRVSVQDQRERRGRSDSSSTPSNGLRFNDPTLAAEGGRQPSRSGSSFACSAAKVIRQGLSLLHGVVGFGGVSFDFQRECDGPPEALVRCNDDNGFRIQQFESRAIRRAHARNELPISRLGKAPHCARSTRQIRKDRNLRPEPFARDGEGSSPSSWPSHWRGVPRRCVG
ncbi:hypothetical protein ACVJMZ_007298, partial [Sinorhizobium medicae]